MTTAIHTKQPGQIQTYIHAAITLALMFLFRFLPAPAPLTAYGMAIVGIFMGMIYGWITSERGLSWISFAALVALGLTDFGSASKVIASIFASDTAGLLLLGMLLIGPMMESQTSEYLIVKVLTSKFCYQKPWRFTCMMVVGIGIMSFVINYFVVALFVLSLLADLFKKAGYQRGDKYPTMMVLGCFIGILLMSGIFPWRGWGLYCTAAFANSSGGYRIDFGKYVIVAVVLYFAVTFGYVLLMRLMGCNVSLLKNMDLSQLKEQYSANGLSRHQKAVIISIVAMAVACIIVSFAGGPTGIRLFIKNIGVYGVMMMTLSCMLFIHVDGKPIADIRICAKHVQWDMLMVIASALCLAGALTSPETGVSALMAQYVAPLLMGRGEYVFMILLTLICLLLTNLSNNMAVMFILMAVTGSFYANGVIENGATTIIIITFASVLGFYTPASSAFGAMIHGSECVTSASVYKYGMATLLFLVVVFAVVIIPLSALLF